MDPASETYMDVRLLIHKMVHKFRKEYGGDQEELFSRANELFMSAFRSHEFNKGKFSTWLCYKIWYGLLDDLRKEQRRRSILKPEEQELDSLPSRPPTSILTDVLISDDSRVIIRLISESPKELRGLMGLSRDKKEGLWDYLRGIGWTVDRIKDSFDELTMLVTGEEKVKEDKTPFITIREGGSGYFAILMSWYEDDRMWDVTQTGIGRYETGGEAYEEALMWAEADGYRIDPSLEQIYG